MLRSPRVLVALVLAPVLLLAACTAVQRRPGTPGTPGPAGTAPRTGMRAAAMDPTDTLSAALDGDGATRGMGATTLVLGNTAFVAYGNGPVGATGATGLTGATGAAPNVRPGTLATPPGGAMTAPGGAAAPGGTAGPAAGTAAPGTATGLDATPGRAGGAGLTGATVAGTLDTGALTRVVSTSLPWVREIRVAHDPDTAARLRAITAEVRAGRPVSDFLDELATLNDQMTRMPVAAGGTPGNATPGAAPGAAPGGAPAPAAPGAAPGAAPAPGGTAPGTTAPPAPGGAAPGR